MKEQLQISFVVPCFNRLQQTMALLDSLDKNRYGCQIIIVDDFSTDDIEGLISGYKSLEVVYHRNDSNKGPAFSRNVGIKLSKFDYVAFTDNDCEITDDWLINMYKSIKISGGEIAGIGGKIIARRQDLISLYYVYHKILDPWYYKGQFLYLTTANAIFKKQALLEVDCFDETIKIAGGEDPGLCFKLANKGYKLLYNPDAIIIHDFQRGVVNFIKTFYRYGFGCSAQSKKYFKKIAFINNEKFAGMDN